MRRLLMLAQLAATVSQTPKLALKQSDFQIVPPKPGWELGMVTSTASDRAGNIYVLHRGDKADPVVMADSSGRVLRSWGRGLFKLPHQIRVDPQGNVWIVDCESSLVMKFTPDGRKLLEIAVGGQPPITSSRFVGATDVAFAPNGHVFVSDGYRNARVVEFTAAGNRVREWGTPGQGPGQFHLPHAIVIDGRGIVYVADRENGRIQRFDLTGRFLGEWPQLGKAFSLDLAAGFLWLGTQPLDQPNGSPGWLMQLDPQSGKALGLVESPGHHSLDVMPGGELMTGVQPNRVLLFRKP